MKKIWLSLTICSLILLSALPTTFASISKIFTDDKNDVINGLDENTTLNAPDIDISKITYYQEGKVVVLTIEVVGVIKDSNIYSAEIETIDENNHSHYYSIWYTKNPLFSGTPTKAVYNNSGEEIPSDFSLVNNKKLRISFEYENPDEKPSLINASTILMDETLLRFGLDMAEFNFTYESDSSNNNPPVDNGQESNSSGKSPGFEIFIALIAVIIGILFFRRKQN